MIRSSPGNDAAPIAAIDNSGASISAAGLERTALAISLAASLFLLGWVLLRCRSGFDFTDEGFYLNWISNPWNFRASISQFGFVYYPLYKLVGGDVASLRQCNVLITFVLAFGLCIALLRSICGELARQSGFAAIAFVIAVGSSSFFGLWLPSPSYNSLAFQSSMLAAIAMLSAGRELSKASVTAWVSIGIAGGIAFLAKPTTAAALGCVVIAYLMVAGKFSFRGMLISAAAAALFLIGSAFAMDGSPVGFVRRMAGGLDFASRISGSRVFDIFRWDERAISYEHRRYLIYVGMGVFAAAVLGFRRNGPARAVAALIVIVAGGLSIAVIFRAASPHISYEPLQAVQFAVISLSVLLAAVTVPAGTFQLSRHDLALFVFFAVLPQVCSFGTTNNYWDASAHAGLFWLMPGVIVGAGLAANAAAWRKLLPAAAASVLVSTGILHVAMENPYRQAQPLRLQTSMAEIGREKSRLFLTEEAASYLRELHRLSSENGFRAGTPMLDLSGVSPGSLYAIGARSLGVAWALGGYSGSNDFVAAALNLETCEAIGRTWILTEPGSKDSISPDLLRRIGIEIERDYLDVGSIESARSFAPLTFQHRLLKPVRNPEAARLACEEARRANPPK